MYVRFDSDHPNHTKSSIPYGLGLRIKRICSEKGTYEKHRTDLKTNLVRRGYTDKFIEKELRKVDKIDRSSALKRSKRKKNTDRVPLVMTYSSHLPDIGYISKSRLNLLHRSERLKTIFKDPPLVAYRRGSNLGDILIHGKLNRAMGGNKVNNRSSKCSQERCTICPHFEQAETFKSTDGKEFVVKKGGTCDTRNVVYLVSCTVCDMPMYVGETERMLKQRIKEHIWDIKADRDKPVAIHFNKSGHSYNNLKVQIIERVSEKNTAYRRIREELWIDKLKTVSPFGLNKKSK